MNTKPSLRRFALAALLLVHINSHFSAARAQGTAFAYQGQLQNNGNPANGIYSLTFSLFNTNTGGGAIAPTVTNNGVNVSGGLFTVTVDFGQGAFIGSSNWLEIAVATNGSGTFTNLSPRQQLTPAPYAVYAESANASNLVGAVPTANLSGVALLNTGNAFTGGNQTLVGGSVGIGTTAPADALHLVGPAGIRAIVQSTSAAYSGFLSENTEANWFMGNDPVSGYGDWEVYENGPVSGVRFLITTNGNIGIGTNMPSTALQVSGTVTATAFSGDGGGLTNLSAAELTGFSAADQPPGGAPILNMVWIVPGTFIMGAPSSDPDYFSDEKQHVVTLTNGFWIGQHPVTQGEYLAVAGSNPSFYPGDLSRPVESVTWLNASNYCNQLTQREQTAGRLPSGWVYRLPTESEWEYCCRAQTTSRYYFGNDPGDGTSLTNYAWYNNNVSTTQPVGQLLPNAWGLVDMAGNVFEWCQDWYVDVYPTANVVYNPQGPATGSDRVVRGAGFEWQASECRSANRQHFGPAVSTGDIGFRVVLAMGH